MEDMNYGKMEDSNNQIVENMNNEKIEDTNNQIVEDINNDKEKKEIPIVLINYIFSYLSEHSWKILYKSSNEKLSIEIIMALGMEEYFKEVLLSYKFKNRLCFEASKRKYLTTLKWARNNGCKCKMKICSIAAVEG